MRFVLALALAFSAIVVYPLANDSQPKPQPKRGKPDSDRVEYYKKWLEEDVVYIITEEERKVFQELTGDEERESFIEQFWLRRDSDPRTSDNEFKEEHYRRIAYANERFKSGMPGWKTDRGRIYIMYGKPDDIDSRPSGGTYHRERSEGGGKTTAYPFEVWRYRYIEGIGSDVAIEFVDKSGTDLYEMALSPSEKDMLMRVPGGAQTLRAELGLAEQQNAPYLGPGALNDPTQGAFLNSKDNPFTRMEQYFNLQRPPQIKFEDLRGIVATHVTYNTLSYDLRTDFIRLSSDKVLVPITIELQNKDLAFKKQQELNQAVVNVYGLVSGLTGRIIAEFESVIRVEYSDQNFEIGKQNRSEYQKIVALPPGQRCKLDLVLKDLNSGHIGVMSSGVNVPKYSAESLQASSVILINSVREVPANSDQLEQYVIGDLKVVPNVRSEYVPGQNLHYYLQVYNAVLDQTTLKPSLEITYVIKSEGRVLEELKNVSDSTVQFFSGQRIVLLDKIPLKEVRPGKYTLEVKISDRIANSSLVSSADFTVNEPLRSASATP